MSQFDRFRWPITFLLLVLIIAGAGVFLYRQSVLPEYSEIVISPPSPDIYIHVDGEVNNPGSYTLQDGDSVGQAIQAAGGFSGDADRGAVNPVAVVRDGDYIYIAKVGDSPQRISINNADLWLLNALPGIGETLAQRIVAYRNENGPFSRIEDLMNVEGIGLSTFTKLEAMISVH